MGYADTRGNFSQATQRREMIFTDQHGRKYHSSVEKKTGMPCGLIQPLFDAPLSVPQMYIEIGTDETRPHFAYINYVRWERDIRTERREWDRLGQSEAAKKYGAQYDITMPLPPDIRQKLGAEPQAVQPVVAARQGNSWVLGFKKTVDQRLIKFFPVEVTDPDAALRDEFDFRDVAELPPDDYTGDDLVDETDRMAYGSDRESDGEETEVEKLRRELAEMREIMDEQRALLAARRELDKRLDLEEDADPNALGGQRKVVKKPASSEAERKAAQRKRKKDDEEAARLKALQDANIERMEAEEQAVRKSMAPPAAVEAAPIVNDDELVEAVTG